MVAFVLNGKEKIVRIEENAGYQRFLLFPKCFQNLPIKDSSNLGLFGKGLN